MSEFSNTTGFSSNDSFNGSANIEERRLAAVNNFQLSLSKNAKKVADEFTQLQKQLDTERDAELKTWKTKCLEYEAKCLELESNYKQALARNVELVKSEGDLKIKMLDVGMFLTHLESLFSIRPESNHLFTRIEILKSVSTEWHARFAILAKDSQELQKLRERTYQCIKHIHNMPREAEGILFGNLAILETQNGNTQLPQDFERNLHHEVGPETSNSLAGYGPGNINGEMTTPSDNNSAQTLHAGDNLPETVSVEANLPLGGCMHGSGVDQNYVPSQSEHLPPTPVSIERQQLCLRGYLGSPIHVGNLRGMPGNPIMYQNPTGLYNEANGASSSSRDYGNVIAQDHQNYCRENYVEEHNTNAETVTRANQRQQVEQERRRRRP